MRVVLGPLEFLGRPRLVRGSAPPRWRVRIGVAGVVRAITPPQTVAPLTRHSDAWPSRSLPDRDPKRLTIRMRMGTGRTVIVAVPVRARHVPRLEGLGPRRR
jgi:hypothetical protein